MLTESQSTPDAIRDRVRAFLAEHDPAEMANQDFNNARFDAGLAWVHYPEGLGGLGVSRALQAVRRGEPAIPRELLGALADEFRARGLRRRINIPGRPAAELTRRQSEVLELLRRGLSTGEIAERLLISPVTVRRHLGLALNKLAAKDRATALRVLEQAEGRA